MIEPIIARSGWIAFRRAKRIPPRIEAGASAKRCSQRATNSMNWDSGYTADTPVQDDPPNLSALRDRQTMGEGRMESRFRHGLAHSGMAPIVRGNDPFWNVRVFETGMRDHDGYTSYPLMCATTDRFDVRLKLVRTSGRDRRIKQR